MGEYAEYMLNGDDCERCGEHIGGGEGFTRLCRSCKNDDRREEQQRRKEKKQLKEAQKGVVSDPHTNT